MGEYADDAIDRMLFGGGGRKRDPDAVPPPQQCNRCGATDVYWVFTGVRWKLMDDETDKPHICEANADGFEDLTK